MRVGEIMIRDVAVVHGEATLDEAVALMRTRACDVLPVHDGERVAGLLIGRDCVERAAAAGLDPRTTRVRAVMVTDLPWGREDQEVREAMALMWARKISELVVLDQAGQPLGRLVRSPLRPMIVMARHAGVTARWAGTPDGSARRRGGTG